MNVASAIASYLQDNNIATSGQDLFIGQAPSSDKVPDSIYWIQASGGDTERLAQTGERIKSYLVEIRYRNRNYQTVYDNLQTLEELLNGNTCIQIDGYETIQIQATTFPIDDDLDSEDRKVGMLAATILTYKEN
jgi:hypothetical protein